MDREVLAALIGLLGVLCGLLISNLIQRWTLQTQLDHDSSERDKERQYAFRKSAYEPAAEAIGVVPAILSELLVEKLDFSLLTARFNESMQALAKAGIAANDDISDAITDYCRVAGQSLLAGLVRRIPLDKALSDRNIASTFVEKALSDQNAIGEMMKQFNLTGSRDDAAFERMRTQFKIASDNFDRYSAEREFAQTEVMRIMRENSGLALAATPELARRGAIVISRMRGELGFAVDEAAFSEKAAKNAAEAVGLGKDALDKIYESSKH